MPKIDMKSKDGYDMFRIVSNASNSLSNLIYTYNETLKSIEWYNDHKSHYSMNEEDLKKEISKEIQSLIKNVNRDIEDIKEDLDRVEIINNRDKKVEESISHNNDSELINGYKVFKADSTNTWFVMDGTGYHNEPEFKGKGYLTKEQAIERAKSLSKGKATTLDEAIKPDVNSEELQKLAKKHNIDILSPMSNGDLRLSGAGADLMKFYQEAESLGLWEVDPSLYENKENTNNDNGKTEIENLRVELSLDDEESYNKFIEEELQEWESELDALKRYKQDLIEAGIDINNLTESYIKEAMLNIDKSAVFDAITNARTYVEENNFYAAEDALLYAAKLVKTPKIEEGGVKRNLLEIESLEKEIKDIEEEIAALEYGIQNAGTRGGNFESADIPELKDDLEKAMQKLAEKEAELSAIKM